MAVAGIPRCSWIRTGPNGDKAPDAGARPGAFAAPAARQEYVYYPSINFRVVELAGPSDIVTE
jgi:hypothetical protein